MLLPVTDREIRAELQKPLPLYPCRAALPLTSFSFLVCFLLVINIVLDLKRNLNHVVFLSCCHSRPLLPMIYSVRGERRIKGKTGSIIQWGSSNTMTGAVFLFTSEHFCSLGGFTSPARNVIYTLLFTAHTVNSFHDQRWHDITGSRATHSDRAQPGPLMNPDTLSVTWAACAQSVDTAVTFNRSLLRLTLSRLWTLVEVQLVLEFYCTGSYGKLLDVSSRKAGGGASQAEGAEGADGATWWRWGVDDVCFLSVCWWFSFAAVSQEC